VQLTSDLPSGLVPLAWLLGSWAGAGVGGYPGVDDYRFGQEVTFSHDGRPFLSYSSSIWQLDDDGNKAQPLNLETGFWRPLPDGQLEVVLAASEGFAEIWVGTVEGPRIELLTDLVARTKDSPGHTAGHRLYGLVEGDLAWAVDVATEDHPLQSFQSARLKRTL
jgi:hypothetical protein